MGSQSYSISHSMANAVKFSQQFKRWLMLPVAIATANLACDPTLAQQAIIGVCSEGVPEGVDFEVDTHAALTEAALTNGNCQLHNFLRTELLISNGLFEYDVWDTTTMPLYQWAEDGSRKEDGDWALDPRPMKHFHDPLTDIGLSCQDAPCSD